MNYDNGGYVEPNQLCPHLFAIDCEKTIDYLSKSFNSSCQQCSDSTEKWMCLYCGNTYCSRYILAHMEEHWMSTLFTQIGGSVLFPK